MFPTTSRLGGLDTSASLDVAVLREGAEALAPLRTRPDVGLTDEVVAIVTTVLLLIAVVSVASGCAGSSDASRLCEPATPHSINLSNSPDAVHPESDCPQTAAAVPSLLATASSARTIQHAGDALVPTGDGTAAEKGDAGRAESPGTARVVRDRRGLKDAWPTPPPVPGSSSIASLR